jgi:hypothetical protein
LVPVLAQAELSPAALLSTAPRIAKQVSGRWNVRGAWHTTSVCTRRLQRSGKRWWRMPHAPRRPGFDALKRKAAWRIWTSSPWRPPGLSGRRRCPAACRWRHAASPPESRPADAVHPTTTIPANEQPARLVRAVEFIQRRRARRPNPRGGPPSCCTVPACSKPVEMWTVYVVMVGVRSHVGCRAWQRRGWPQRKLPAIYVDSVDD